MSLRIDWNTLSPAKWDRHLKQIRRVPLLQSYDYARAICHLQKKQARWGLIHIDDKPAGLVQMIEIKVMGQLFHTVEMDFGPLWFDAYNCPENTALFFSAFCKSFPKRLGRMRRILPNAQAPEADKETLENHLQTLKMKKIVTPDYQTIWVNLDYDEQTLRDNLKGKWRNILNKAEKQGLNIQFSYEDEDLNFILKNYALDKAAKNYQGPSLPLLKTMAQTFASNKNMLIGTASMDNQIIAGIVIFIHGESATYQVAWASEDGKKHGAPSLLLWRAMLELQSKEVKDFDLGGINDNTAKTVKRFKEGLGGVITTYPGQYS